MANYRESRSIQSSISGALSTTGKGTDSTIKPFVLLRPVVSKQGGRGQ